LKVQQNKNGGFPLHKDGADSPSEVDVTAMGLQALANYRDQEAVEEAVESALEWLSEQQLASGGFQSLKEENRQSVSQVMIALTALNIDPLEERFLQKDGSLLSNLLSFATDDGGFAHTRGGKTNRSAPQPGAFHYSYH